MIFLENKIKYLRNAIKQEYIEKRVIDAIHDTRIEVFREFEHEIETYLNRPKTEKSE